MSDMLDNWLTGSPVVGSGIDTTRFTHWLHGAPLISLGSSIPLIDAGYIVTAGPHWGDPVDLTLSIKTVKQRSLSGAEARRALGTTLQVQMRWSAVMSADQLAKLRNLIQASANTTFVVPLWPVVMDGSTWATDARIRGGVTLAFDDDFARWDFSTDGTITSPESWGFICPAVVGRITIEATANGPASSIVRFEFTEDSASTYAITADAESWPSGATLADASTPPRFPLDAVWQSPPTAGGADLTVERRELGAARQMASAFWGQSAEQIVVAEAALTSARDVGKAVRWFSDRAGDVGAQFVDGLVDCGVVAANASAGASVLDMADASLIGANRFLQLDNRNGTIECVRVVTVTDNRLTLGSPLANHWTAGDSTRVTLAMLARLARSDLSIRFSAPNVAACRFSWRELPPEYAPASVETRGTTLGALADRAWLYELTFDRVGTSSVYRFTGSQRDLTDGSSNVWTSTPIEHSQVGGSIHMDREDGRITMRYASPLDRFLPGRNDGILRVKIYAAAISGASITSTTLLFSGQATGMQCDGPFADIQLSGASRIFDRPIPRLLLQRTCNHLVFDSACGLSLAAWTFTATVDSAGAGGVTLKSFSRPSGLPTGWGFANYFALGYLQRLSGERLLIAGSAAVDGLLRVLCYLVAEPAAPLQPGEVVSVFPGCDGNPTTCKAYNASTNPTGKFNNYPAFGGFPGIPSKNPEFKPIEDSATGSGKKG